jgi:hypothetical protein
LQPTAESAKIWYQGSLASRKFQVISDKRDTVLVENPGHRRAGRELGSTSWWTAAHDDKSSKAIRAPGPPRGAPGDNRWWLSGNRRNKGEGSQGVRSSRSLTRVLQSWRGDLGKADTGVTPMLHLEVNGTGKAGQIQYVGTGPGGPRP